MHLSTNILAHALKLNLDAIPAEGFSLDTFSVSLLEKLVLKIQKVIAKSEKKPYEGSIPERDNVMKCFYQDPELVHCRFCKESIFCHEEAVRHMHQHEKDDKQLVETDPCYLRVTCIPRWGGSLLKQMRKFLDKYSADIMNKKGYDSMDSQTAADNEKNILQQLVSALNKSYPKVKCYAFGSRTTGTGSFKSDLDIFVDLESVYGGRKYRKDVENIAVSIVKVRSTLQKMPNWEIIDMVLGARVPLLRVLNTNYDMICDLTFSNGLAHRNSLLLQYMYSLQPTCRQLVCYIKEWNRESSLNSYTISLMAIFFYQYYGWLPAVASLQDYEKTILMIDDWDTGFRTPTLAELNLRLCDCSISMLAAMFFNFYSIPPHFCSLESEVVSPFSASNESKRLYGCTNAPIFEKYLGEMERFKWYMQDHLNDQDRSKTFAYNRPFVIQDPFEHCHNVAKGITVEAAARLL
uniref:Poly(A) RNA polymerase mitochondrial-like central palm domain-containing protein n=1 Tax=Anopheles dirus TaxID=7168 RepID=A0A182NDE7_9DIPT